MNEKLREIAVKAQVEHCVSHVRLQEFAELIVKECADYIQHFYGDIAASSIGNDIKLHFGIEE